MRFSPVRHNQTPPEECFEPQTKHNSLKEYNLAGRNTYVGQGVSVLRVRAEEKVDSSALCLFAEQEVVEFSSRSGQGLARPVRDFADAQSLCVAMWKKEFDSGGYHKRANDKAHRRSVAESGAAQC